MLNDYPADDSKGWLYLASIPVRCSPTCALLYTAEHMLRVVNPLMLMLVGNRVWMN